MSATTSHDRMPATPAFDEAAITADLVDWLRIPTISGDEALASGHIAQWVDAHEGWSKTSMALAASARAVELSRKSGEELAGRENHYLTMAPLNPQLPSLYINAHYDVVPVLDEDQWSEPPFGGNVRDGVAYGRGAIDNKGGLVAALHAMESLRPKAGDLPFNIVLELAAGEENTGIGTIAGMELRPERLAAIVLEPTNNVVAVANTGMLFFTISMRGEAVHTSVPWRGHDALRTAVDLYSRLQEYGQGRAERATHPAFEGCPNIVPLVVGKLSGGRWRAALPDVAEMAGRIGLLPDESVDAVRAEFEQLIEEFGRESGLDEAYLPQLRWDNHGLPGWTTDTDEPVAAALLGAAAAILETEVVAGGMTCGCDAGTIQREGIPTIVFGPGDIALAHSSREAVALADVRICAEILARGISALAAAIDEETSR